jgi:hypothetical protein
VFKLYTQTEFKVNSLTERKHKWLVLVLVFVLRLRVFVMPRVSRDKLALYLQLLPFLKDDLCSVPEEFQTTKVFLKVAHYSKAVSVSWILEGNGAVEDEDGRGGLGEDEEAVADGLEEVKDGMVSDAVLQELRDLVAEVSTAYTGNMIAFFTDAEMYGLTWGKRLTDDEAFEQCRVVTEVPDGDTVICEITNVSTQKSLFVVAARPSCPGDQSLYVTVGALKQLLQRDIGIWPCTVRVMYNCMLANQHNVYTKLFGISCPCSMVQRIGVDSVAVYREETGSVYSTLEASFLTEKDDSEYIVWPMMVYLMKASDATPKEAPSISDVRVSLKLKVLQKDDTFHTCSLDVDAQSPLVTLFPRCGAMTKILVSLAERPPCVLHYSVMGLALSGFKEFEPHEVTALTLINPFVAGVKMPSTLGCNPLRIEQGEKFYPQKWG